MVAVSGMVGARVPEPEEENVPRRKPRLSLPRAVVAAGQVPEVWPARPSLRGLLHRPQLPALEAGVLVEVEEVMDWVLCAHCLRRWPGHGGTAFGGQRLCHTDTRSCYTLVTRERHPMPCDPCIQELYMKEEE